MRDARGALRLWPFACLLGLECCANMPSEGYSSLTFVEKLRLRVAYLILETVKDPWNAATNLVLYMIPLLMLAAVMVFKFYSALKKQKRRNKDSQKKEKLLRRLQKQTVAQPQPQLSSKNEVDAEKPRRRVVNVKVSKELTTTDLLRIAEQVCNENLDNPSEHNAHEKEE